jgi:two-component system cell cycle sensor histidine kinase/response regulator CckA
MRAKSGDWRWLHGRCRAVARDSNGRASRIIGTQTDITERKLVMEALRDSEARFRGTFEQAAVGVAQVSPEGKFLRINQRFCDFLGYSRDEMLNREFQDVTYPDDLNSSIEIVSRLIDEELERYSTEKRYCRKDGSVVWGNLTVSLVRKSDNSPDYFISVVQDISERKRAEEALTESENRYRELFNSVLEGIGIVDEFDMVRYVNPALVTIFGENSADVMLGKNLLEYFTESQRQIIRKEIDHGRCGLGSQCEVELQLSNGIKKFLLVSTKPRFDRERNYAGAFITFLNITETKRLKQLESRAERLELAGTIAGQVAHDLNNLLAPLVAYPELIRDELPPDHEVLAYLDDIEDAAKKIADINQDLLTMGRRGHYNQEVLDLNRIVNRAVQEIRPQTTADLKTLLRDDLSRIKGGATQIYRVITNLIVNALDALHDGGKVFIETENFIADSTSVSFGKIPKGEYVRLTIADTGCGIPDDIIQKIFDPFFSTKTNERKRGSGLGLSIVDAVMKDHGGYIDLRTTVGRGTTFYLYFPVTRESLERTESDPPLGSGETILVVDDERIQREVSTELLTRLGYFVSSVESGEVAIEFLRGNPQDLVILDMVMPRGLDGVETFRQMLKLSPHQKAIILSGYSEMDRVAEIRKLGVGAYIRKPVSRRELAFAVRRELDRHAEKVPS